MELSQIERLAIGDILERPPSHHQGEYLPAIHTAIIERIALSGVWCRSYPNGALYHVSFTALELGWWTLKDNEAVA
jgi:hypothetical protein